MFGMGWSEIILIGIVGVLVFGPDKLPEFARQSARLVRTVRRMAQDAKDDLGRELGHDLSGLELRDLDPREVVRRTFLDDSPPASTPPKPQSGEARQPGSVAQSPKHYVPGVPPAEAGERAERAPRVPPIDPDAT